MVRLAKNATPIVLTIEGPNLSMSNMSKHSQDCDAAKVQLIMDHIQRDAFNSVRNGIVLTEGHTNKGSLWL